MPENYVQSIVLRIRKNKKKVELYNRLERMFLVVAHITWVICFSLYIVRNTDTDIEVLNRAIVVSIVGFLLVALILHITFSILRGLRFQENQKLRSRRRSA